VRVSLELSGGFGGLFAAEPLTADASDADLSDHERAALTALAVPSGGRGGPRVPAAAGPPDAFTYRLTVDTGGGQRTVTYNDVTLPRELRPLVERLRARAMAERGKRN
jgi:hypothetical protein